jgi:hypothetical protein
VRLLRLLLVTLCLACASCAERPMFGVEIGTQTVKDCIPGSVTKPCN